MVVNAALLLFIIRVALLTRGSHTSGEEDLIAQLPGRFEPKREDVNMVLRAKENIKDKGSDESSLDWDGGAVTVTMNADPHPRDMAEEWIRQNAAKDSGVALTPTATDSGQPEHSPGFQGKKILYSSGDDLRTPYKLPGPKSTLPRSSSEENLGRQRGADLPRTSGTVTGEYRPDHLNTGGNPVQHQKPVEDPLIIEKPLNNEDAKKNPKKKKPVTQQKKKKQNIPTVEQPPVVNAETQTSHLESKPFSKAAKILIPVLVVLGVLGVTLLALAATGLLNCL